MEEGQPLTHIQPGLLGDRTSGFNGVRTSGPFRLHPRKGSRKRTRVNPRKGSCHGLLLPTMCLFSSLGHLPVASWATQKQVREVKAAQAPESSRRCPWGRDAHAACGGIPKHSNVLKLPKLLVRASVLVPVPVICLSVHLTRGRGSVPGLGLSVFPKVGHICPHTLALHVPGQGRGPWPHQVGQKDHARVSRLLLFLSGSGGNIPPPNSSPQQSNTSSEDTNNISTVNLKKNIYILYI